MQFLASHSLFFKTPIQSSAKTYSVIKANSKATNYHYLNLLISSINLKNSFTNPIYYLLKYYFL